MQTGLFYFFGGRRHKICCELGYGVPPRSLIQLGPLQIFAFIAKRLLQCFLQQPLFFVLFCFSKFICF